MFGEPAAWFTWPLPTIFHNCFGFSSLCFLWGGALVSNGGALVSQPGTIFSSPLPLTVHRPTQWFSEKFERIDFANLWHRGVSLRWSKAEPAAPRHFLQLSKFLRQSTIHYPTHSLSDHLPLTQPPTTRRQCLLSVFISPQSELGANTFIFSHLPLSDCFPF